VSQRAIEHERKKDMFKPPNPTLKTRIIAYLIDCLALAFPDDTFEFDSPKVVRGYKQIRSMALSVLREMKGHVNPIREDFFASAGNDVQLALPDTFRFKDADKAHRHHFAAVLESRVYRTTRIPVHHCKKQWIARGLLGAIAANTGRGNIEEEDEVKK
jgi:hypothetical protein